MNKWHMDTPRYKETLVSFSGIRMVIHSNMAYLQTRKELIAFDRFLREKLVKEKKPIDECMKWKTPSDATYSLILADNILFAGGDNKVVAINAKTGEVLSEAKVMGKAYGLAVGKDRLFVSTDQGAIHCFGGAEYKQRIEPSIDPSPYSHDSLTKIYTSVAKRIIDKTGIKQGYCLVLGCGEGRLAYEIAKLTDLKIIGIEKDPKKVETARRALDRAGLYGVRVTIHQGSPSDLSSYPKYFANLIVSDEMLISGKISGSAKDLYHLLRPFGGVAYLGQAAASSTFGEKGLKEDKLKKWFTDAAIKEWKTAKDKDGLWALVDRGPLSGSGEWTHMYANAGNTACSNDKLVSTPTQLLWFGEPGPAPMIDRHQRSSAPLFKDGRMFIAGRDRVMTVDAYNGTILWDQSIPNFTRTGMNLDGGPMAVTKDYLYAVAEDRCLGFNVGTGENSLTFKVPQLAEGETRHWGYLATVGDLLFGSGQKPGASRNPYASGKFDKKMEREVWGEFRNVVTSHYLFALNRHSGEKVWLYQSDGVIPNVAITAGDGRIYFIESSDPKALMEDKGGRVPLKALGRSNLVALDMKTGKAIWKKEIDLSKAHHVLYLSYAQGCLLVTMCSTKNAQPHYDLDAFDAATGKAKWSNDHPSIYGWPGMGHGQESKHPVIMGNKIISEPFDFDLQTGKKGNFLLSRAGRGCGTISASATCIFFRANTPAVYDLAKDKQFRMSKVSRPGCWLNLIGAGGLVLMPEATQGCVCNYPIQASYAFVPVDGKGKVASVK